MARLVSINISSGGIPKLPVSECRVTERGLENDGQAHAKHVKSNRAVSLLDIEIVNDLRAEGYDVVAGALGENVTVEGLSQTELSVGDFLAFENGVVLELTEPRRPCFVLDAVHPELKEVTVGRIGWMAKVVECGVLKVNDEITVIKKSEDLAMNLERSAQNE